MSLNNHHLALDVIDFKVIAKPYSKVRAIFAELGRSDTTLLRALREGHAIEFDSLTEDPTLYFVVSSQQLAGLKKSGIKNPTFLQVLGTCEIISLSEDEAKKRFLALKAA